MKINLEHKYMQNWILLIKYILRKIREGKNIYTVELEEWDVIYGLPNVESFFPRFRLDKLANFVKELTLRNLYN